MMNNKEVILITGSVLNSDLQSVITYEYIKKLFNEHKYEVFSPLETLEFKGSDQDRYRKALDVISKSKLMIAEMSNVSTGQGMEIQYAALLGVPILVIAKKDSKVSGLVKGCPAVKKIIFYENIHELKSIIPAFVESIQEIGSESRSK